MFFTVVRRPSVRPSSARPSVRPSVCRPPARRPSVRRRRPSVVRPSVVVVVVVVRPSVRRSIWLTLNCQKLIIIDGFRPWEYRETISNGPELLVAYFKIYVDCKNIGF